MDVSEPGSHLDHLLRQTRMHHMSLSVMADAKANMMLTIASVVLTLSLRYTTDPDLRWTAVALILFCFATIVLAAFAVMPRIRGRKEAPDPRAPGFNLLFFGDFSRLSWPEYLELMEEVFRDPGKAYEVQLREVYLHGVFLRQKKYRFVRYSYIAFISGLVASGLLALLNGVI